MLATPGKVSRIQPQRAELGVPTSHTDGMDPFRAELCVGGLTTELELSLLAVVGALSTRGRTFVPGGTGDTYMSRDDHFEDQHKRIRTKRKETDVSIFRLLEFIQTTGSNAPMSKVLRLEDSRRLGCFGGQRDCSSQIKV